jgi:transposase
VRLHLEVRRFACQAAGCGRKTFAEGWPAFLVARARRTSRLKGHHLATAYALGGEGGRRLATQMGMPISGDTLIRDLRQAPEPPDVAVRVVGIDDWALKKGSRYGTILVDLEAHQPLDLLDSREADDVAAWLQAHPEIEIVSRDRGKDYIKAATEGAPQAEQVADRWHLLANLREAVATYLDPQPACLQAAAQGAEADPKNEALLPPIQAESQLSESDPQPEPAAPATSTANQPLTKAQQDPAARRARRQARFDQTRQLKQAGYSARAIGRQMKMSFQTVRKYGEADTCPQYPAGRVGPSKLTPWLPHLEQRWQQGCTNASQLWREIAQQGFSGSLGLVVRWAANQRNLLPANDRYRRQQAETRKPALARQRQPPPWSAQRASWLITLDEDRLDERQQAARRALLAADPQMAVVDRLARQFIQMMKARRPADLAPWLTEVADSGIQALQSFANGLRSDLAAVRNALSMVFSNGQVEGQINRLKCLKRQMFGRAKLDLLRKRFLYRPLPP